MNIRPNVTTNEKRKKKNFDCRFFFSKSVRFLKNLNCSTTKFVVPEKTVCHKS